MSRDLVSKGRCALVRPYEDTMTRPKKPTAPQFPEWEGRKCGWCGKRDNTDEPAYKLQCPECLRLGCEDCMPMGRGCICPECEGS